MLGICNVACPSHRSDHDLSGMVMMCHGSRDAWTDVPGLIDEDDPYNMAHRATLTIAKAKVVCE